MHRGEAEKCTYDIFNDLNAHTMRMDDVKTDNTILKERVKRLEELLQAYARSSDDSSGSAHAEEQGAETPVVQNASRHEFLGLGILSSKSRDDSPEAGQHYKSLTSWDAILHELDELKLAISDSTFDPAYPHDGTDFAKSIHGGGPFFGSPQQSLAALLSYLPLKGQMDLLLSQYFNSYHAIYPIIHPLAFKKQYRSFLLAPDDPATLALLFSMMALSIVNNDPDNVNSDEYARYALQALQVSEFTINFTITTVTALINILFYYMRERAQQTFTWITLGFALQIARALGLHRDPSNFGIVGQECQTRRHIWTALLVQDAMAAARYGRTTVIDIDEWDTKAPIEKSENGKLEESLPAMFSYAKRQVSLNIAKAFKSLFRPRARPSYQTILDLEDYFRQTHASLLVYAPDDPMPGAKQPAPAHSAAQWLYSRYSLFTLSHTLIVIHRPFLIKKSRQFHQSRVVCLQAARQIVNVVFGMEAHLKDNTLPGLQHYAWHVRESAKIAYLPAATVLCVGLYIRNQCEFDALPIDAPVASAAEDCMLIELIISKLKVGSHAHSVVVQLYSKVKETKPDMDKDIGYSLAPDLSDYSVPLSIANNLATGGQRDWNHFMSSTGMLDTNSGYSDQHQMGKFAMGAPQANHDLPQMPARLFDNFGWVPGYACDFEKQARSGQMNGYAQASSIEPWNCAHMNTGEY